MKSIEVPETKAASFECEVSHFNVPSMWLKNGVEIEMSEKFKIVVQGKLHQLIIMNTSTEDAAEYTFVCGNDQVSATLTVTRKSIYGCMCLCLCVYVRIWVGGVYIDTCTYLNT